MLLDTLRDEEDGLHRDDEMMKQLKDIAEKGASQRPMDRYINLLIEFFCRLSFVFILVF